MKRKAAGVLAALTLIFCGYAEAADPALSCKTAKEKIAGKYLTCLRKAEATFTKTGDTDNIGPDLAACATKFTDAWSKAEMKASKAGVACADPTPDATKDLMECMSGCISVLNGSGSTCLCAVGACPNGGKRVGAACWYWSATGQSCDSRCADYGLTNSSATRSYAGSDGTFAHCDKVLDAFGAPETPSHGDEGDCQDGWGCYYDVASAGRTRCIGLVTTGASSTPDGRRACACE